LFLSAVNGQKKQPMVGGQWSMVKKNSQWSAVNGRWSEKQPMVGGQWSIVRNNSQATTHFTNKKTLKKAKSPCSKTI
jgi:hypothetical protein